MVATVRASAAAGSRSHGPVSDSSWPICSAAIEMSRTTWSSGVAAIRASSSPISPPRPAGGGVRKSGV
jgi:hypothetical protein